MVRSACPAVPSCILHAVPSVLPEVLSVKPVLLSKTLLPSRKSLCGLRIYFICKKTQNMIGLRVVWPVVSNPINTTFYRNKAEPSLYTTVSIFHPYFVHRFILFPKIPNLFLFPFTFPTLFFNHLFILLTLFYFC